MEVASRATVVSSQGQARSSQRGQQLARKDPELGFPVSSQGQPSTSEALTRSGSPPACACMLPSCKRCSALATPSPSPAPPRPRHVKRQQRKPGVKRALSQELVDDSGTDSDPDGSSMTFLLQVGRGKHRQRLQVELRSSQAPWDFWELWGGCGNFTAAMIRRGAVVGPCVDILTVTPAMSQGQVSVPRLRLDLEDDGDVEFLWWLLHEFRPRYVHASPPCTFWNQLGRMTATRLPAEWMALRSRAVRHLRLAVMIMRWQSRHGRQGSLEQPPRSVSWRLGRTEALLSQPRWRRFTWPSCQYGHKDPGNGLLYLKYQGFASNVDLTPMQVKCSCERGSHQTVHGVVEEGERAGEQRATVSGEYPPAMCDKLAGIIWGR